MSRSNILLIALVAFFVPIGAVLFQHRDRIAEMNRVDPSQGELLFFTSPG